MAKGLNVNHVKNNATNNTEKKTKSVEVNATNNTTKKTKSV